MSAIVQFLEGSGRDGAGRTIDEVLAFGLGALEHHHDFIQWLFPLSEPSAAVPGSPVLTDMDVAAIGASTLAQAHLAAGAERMAWFYAQTDHWLRPADHNHLRITRIIKSLRLLSGDVAANRFRSRILALIDGPRAKAMETALAYWAAA